MFDHQIGKTVMLLEDNNLAFVILLFSASLSENGRQVYMNTMN
jgi:hypothetical protein